MTEETYYNQDQWHSKIRKSLQLLKNLEAKKKMKLRKITHTLGEIGSKLKEMEKKHAKSPNS